MLEIELIQVALGVRDSLSRVPSDKEWDALYAFAEKHAIVGVLWGGVERLPKEQTPYMDLLMEWLGQAEYQRTQYHEQRKAVESLKRLWEENQIKVIELKGDSIGRYYPHPELRYSCDFDCFLVRKTKTEKTASVAGETASLLSDSACLSESQLSTANQTHIAATCSSSPSREVKNSRFAKNNFSDKNLKLETLKPFETHSKAYELGNKIVEAQGVEVNRDFYKNSSFVFEGLHVENHQFCTPVRGNRAMKRFERILEELLWQEANPSTGSGTAGKGQKAKVDDKEPLVVSHKPLAKPLVQFNALFLMEHAWAHFFEEALTMKQVIDWCVFRKECSTEVDWTAFEKAAKDCGFWEFAVAMNKIVDGILGTESKEGIDGIESNPSEPSLTFSTFSTAERRLWDCILQGGGEVEMNNGWNTRWQLIRNYFTNSWKYRYFAPNGALYTLARTSLGYLFDRNPKI